MGMRLSKEQSDTVVRISWASLASIGTSLAAVWAFGAPLVQSVMAAEVKKEIENQLKPVQSLISAQTAANIVSLSATIKNLRTSITALEFKRDMCKVPDCWTIRDAGDLDAARIDLKAAENAIALLRN